MALFSILIGTWVKLDQIRYIFWRIFTGNLKQTCKDLFEKTLASFIKTRNKHLPDFQNYKPRRNPRLTLSHELMT